MIRVTGRDELVGRPARLVFRTSHIDKAGETSAARTVEAEVAELDATGTAVLVRTDGLHVVFPAAHLHPDGGSLIGGQERIRDIHSATAPATPRRMDRAVVEREMANA